MKLMEKYMFFLENVQNTKKIFLKHLHFLVVLSNCLKQLLMLLLENFMMKQV